MDSYIIWPSFWWNTAFIIACLILIAVFFYHKINRENCKESELTLRDVKDSFLKIVMNMYVLAMASVFSLLVGLVGTICLLHFSDISGLLFVIYLLLSLLVPIVPVVILVDDETPFNPTGILCCFVYAAGQSVIGFIFLVCNNFSYMWYGLLFIFLNLIGAFLEYYRLRKN